MKSNNLKTTARLAMNVILSQILSITNIEDLDYSVSYAAFNVFLPSQYFTILLNRR